MQSSTIDNLSVRDLAVTYAIGGNLFGQRQLLQAVQDITFEIARGKTIGVVGESGCGKSSLARALVGLAPVSDGEIRWAGSRISGLSEHEFRPLRKDIQMVFQDPFASLNPKMKLFDLIAEPLRTHMPDISRTEMDRSVRDVLDVVGLHGEMLGRYRHELSGGQAQRVGIARAIVTQPGLLVCDEAVSALDVSVQAIILNLLKTLQRDMDLAMIFISHDLGVVKYISDTIMVLYLGRIVEIGPCLEVLDRPRHPYTQRLLASSLSPNAGPLDQRKFSGDDAEPPSPLNPPSGCAFRTRCDRARDICASERPEPEMSDNVRRVACHFPIQHEMNT